MKSHLHLIILRLCFKWWSIWLIQTLELYTMELFHDITNGSLHIRHPTYVPTWVPISNQWNWLIQKNVSSQEDLCHVWHSMSISFKNSESFSWRSSYEALSCCDILILKFTILNVFFLKNFAKCYNIKLCFSP